MNRSESIAKLAVALVKFNAEIGSIKKDANNPFFKSQYVTLDNLIIHTRDLLQKQGLVVMQSPLSREDGSIGIQTMLIHESGEFIESEPIYMKPAKVNDPQQAGSVISYMRRYSYQAILNLNTGEDDDGNKASDADKKQQQQDKKQQQQVNENMTAEEAGKIIIGFGKHKGLTLKEIYKKDNQYFLWLKDKAQTENIKQAVSIMLVALKDKSLSKIETKPVEVDPDLPF